jgi:hypothetical protein
MFTDQEKANHPKVCAGGVPYTVSTTLCHPLGRFRTSCELPLTGHEGTNEAQPTLEIRATRPKSDVYPSRQRCVLPLNYFVISIENAKTFALIEWLL